MEFKEAIEYLISQPVFDIDDDKTIIALRVYMREVQNGCEVCNDMPVNDIFVYCPRCGKKLDNEEENEAKKKRWKWNLEERQNGI